MGIKVRIICPLKGVLKLNREAIVNKVKPFLTTKNCITKSTFKKLFTGFSQLDLIEVINILEENCIFVDITETIMA